VTCQDIAGGEQSIRGRNCYCNNGNEYTEEGGCEGACLHAPYGVADTVSTHQEAFSLCIH
jgi:hypothetical protein